MSFNLMLPPILGVVGLAIAFVIYTVMSRASDGEDKVRGIAEQIHIGAMVFMHREYKMLLAFAAVLVVGILVSPLGTNTAIAFIAGAVSSATAGYLGMYAATKANVRTAVAANQQGAAAALNIAFYGGSIMGLCVASLGLLGLGGLYYYFGGDPHTAHAIHGFGMGGSVVALFSRVGGGIYTKSADVGADLVGKVEAGIPEDDPRNPGVIADNVGDNVGDIAGMGSDIFESYCGSMIACIRHRLHDGADDRRAERHDGIPAGAGQYWSAGFRRRYSDCARTFIGGTRGGASQRNLGRAGYFYRAGLVFVREHGHLAKHLVGSGIRCRRGHCDRFDHGVLHRWQAGAHDRQIR